MQRTDCINAVLIAREWRFNDRELTVFNPIVTNTSLLLMLQFSAAASAATNLAALQVFVRDSFF